MKRASDLIATGFYVGYFPIAPGTFGSATVGILLWVLGLAFKISFLVKILFFVFITVIGLIATAELLKSVKAKDPGYIVIDEWAGQLMCYLFVPLTLETLVVGFIFFRIFDILKIYPVNKAENFRGAYGVMFDDIIAGIYAGIFLYIWNIWI